MPADHEDNSALARVNRFVQASCRLEAVAILFALFVIQSRGTAQIAKAFGPGGGAAPNPWPRPRARGSLDQGDGAARRVRC